MRTVILAGGRGTRLSEETSIVPKPMVKIAGKPILWHIMQIYAAQGHCEFTLALGYLGDVIRDYVRNLPYLYSDLTVNLAKGNVDFKKDRENLPLVISTLETGLDTQTGGRVLRAVESFDDEIFMITYGDGLGNVDVSKLIKFHIESKKLLTVTAVRPPARFGNLNFDEHKNVSHFGEKVQTDAGWINGGFFVANRKIMKYFDSDSDIFEQEVMNRITRDGQLSAFQHLGFWQPMDTIRERDHLDKLAAQENPPWLNF